MFANPIWSILLLCAPVALYWFVIRPRLQARFTDLYTNVDTLLGRIWARIWAFRTPVIGAIGAIVAAAPDIIVKLAPVDFSTILPQPWGLWVGTSVGIIIPVMKAFETTPGQVPPPAGT